MLYLILLFVSFIFLILFKMHLNRFIRKKELSLERLKADHEKLFQECTRLKEENTILQKTLESTIDLSPAVVVYSLILA